MTGEAADGVEALALTKERRPNLVLMSAELPRMDVFETTRRIMTEVPTPIVILSTDVDARQVELSMDALRAGAVSVQRKPITENLAVDPEAARQLLMNIKAMAQVKLVRRWPDRSARPASRPPIATEQAPWRRIVAIGASTGGPAAIHRILSELPDNFPLPILVVQHIAVGFLAGFVSWLNTAGAPRVKIAEDGEPLQRKTVYVASDNRHLGVSSRSTIILSADPPIGGFRPAATFLFDSVTKAYGKGAINVILTGMGQDGLQGLHAARRRGSYVLAQDEESSIVFGMPGSAVSAGLADAVLPLSRIAAHLIEISENDRDG
jgi:two-component system chemotaxis response regulator CheB